MTAPYHDIAVLGSGPAALSLAAACARRGASVAILSPDPEASWTPNYCLWTDEVPSGMHSLAERVWPEALVTTPLGSHSLGRPYVKLHTLALQALYRTMLRAAGARAVPGRAVRLEHRADHSTIHLDGGGSERARVVVDASGAGTAFVDRVHDRAPAAQTAYGLMLRPRRPSFDPDRMVLMDFRPADLAAASLPSFLYVLPFDDGRVFLEETSLAHRPGMPIDVLRTRLETRLASLGLQDAERLGEERCFIPMGLGLPVARQRVVPFGAAASMVHPASGYMIAHVLRKADPVAQSLVENLDAPTPSAAIDSANATLWPRAQRATWEIYSFGLESLLRMDGNEIGRFFNTFFGLPQHAWAGFLGGTLERSELVAVMTRFFRNLPASVRWRLLRTGLSAGVAPLSRSVLQPGMT